MNRKQRKAKLKRTNYHRKVAKTFEYKFYKLVQSNLVKEFNSLIEEQLIINLEQSIKEKQRSKYTLRFLIIIFTVLVLLWVI